MYKVGIVGATGYTGVELLRLLAGHPEVDVNVITSRLEQGQRVDTLYPNLRGHYDLQFATPDVQALRICDLVFFATPHGVSMHMMRELLAAGTRVVDLSADFRLRDAEQWSNWYGQAHACPELLTDAVYGMPEMYREQIVAAQLVAAPGCYPTSVQLGLLPLLEQGLVDTEHLIANAASGASGAGRQAKVDNLLAEVSDSFKAYAVAGHRHLPEIEQTLSSIAKTAVNITFVPHLLPIIRGIHATLYARLCADLETDLQALYEQRYANEAFVDVLPAGVHPQTRTVKGSNMCRLAVFNPQDSDTVVVLSVIDNLVKGAAGQAVQCMNIMLDLAETRGLEGVALTP
ncbi:MAG: N-acetyl-gamma-glutamyl-phosphate reductase [Pseudomonadales bacterium]